MSLISALLVFLVCPFLLSFMVYAAVAFFSIEGGLLMVACDDVPIHEELNFFLVLIRGGFGGLVLLWNWGDIKLDNRNYMNQTLYGF